MSRAAQPQPQPARMPAAPAESPRSAERKPRNRKEDLLSFGSWVGSNALLFVVALLVAAVVWFIYSASPATQSRYINSSKLQAVFLNTGQVYFGDIRALSKDYLVLSNVYYLQSSSADSKASSQNISLVKLGCELHRPYDAMVINLAQVTFWENLQSDGQVGKAVAQFQQQNPNGQKCSDAPAPASGNLQNQTPTKQ